VRYCVPEIPCSKGRSYELDLKLPLDELVYVMHVHMYSVMFGCNFVTTKPLCYAVGGALLGTTLEAAVEVDCIVGLCKFRWASNVSLYIFHIPL
jgi:hypothetical protein